MFSDYQIKQRHELLATTIGVKEEEEASLSASNTLVITMTVCMIVFSILEGALYLLYNRKVHRIDIRYMYYVPTTTFLVPPVDKNNQGRNRGLCRARKKGKRG